MSELADIWHEQEQYTPRGAAHRSRENENLREKLEEAKALLFEAVDRYPVENDPKLWTSKVRKWLKSGPK